MIDKCRRCGNELVGKLKVRYYATYFRKECRTCVNKESKEKQRKISKRLKEWRKYYGG